MTTSLIIGLVGLTLLASLFLILPLLLTPVTSRDDLGELQAQYQTLKQQLQAGTIKQHDFDQQAARLEDHLLALGAVNATAATTSASKRPILLALWLAIMLAFLGYVIYDSTGDAVVDDMIALEGEITPANAKQFIAMQQLHLTKNEKDTLGWAQLANAYAMLGDHAEAIAAGKQAITLSDRKSPEALMSYAEALIVSKHPVALEKAYTELQHLITLDASYTPAYFALGYLALQVTEGNPKQALAYWQHVANDPNSPLRSASFMNDFLQLWGVVNKKDYTKAARYIDQALLLGEKQDTFAFYRWQAALGNKNYRLAHKYFQKMKLSDKQKQTSEFRLLEEMMISNYPADSTVSTLQVTITPPVDLGAASAIIFVTPQQGSQMPLAVCAVSLADLPNTLTLDTRHAMRLHTLADYDAWQVVVNITTAKQSWVGQQTASSVKPTAVINALQPQARMPLPVPRAPKPCVLP